MKKLFIISTIALLLVVVLLLVYRFVYKKDDGLTDISSEKISTSSEGNIAEKKQVQQSNIKEEIAQGKIKKIVNNEVFFPIVDESGNKIKYYNNIENGFWESSFDGSFKKKLVNDDFSELDVIIWSPDKKNVILKIKGDFYGYKYSEEPKKIKDNMQYLVWSNLGDKIIYIYKNASAKKNELNIADKDGSNWKNLTTMDINKRYIISVVPQTSLISFWEKPDSHTKTSINTIGISGGTVEKISVDRFGADYLWSPNGEKFLVSSVSREGGNNMILELGELNKDSVLNNLNFPTLASKCVWSKDNKIIYCALPSGILGDAIMPNDYWSGKFYTTDSFWKIDTVSGKKDRIVELDDIDEKIDATNLFLSSNEDILFFVNRRNNSLYRITL